MVDINVKNCFDRPDVNRIDVMQEADLCEWAPELFTALQEIWVFEHANVERATCRTKGTEDAAELECGDSQRDDWRNGWKKLSQRYDGVFRIGSEVYFFRSPVNDPHPSDLVCKNDDAEWITPKLTVLEAATIALWTPLSENTGFARCAVDVQGQGIYRALIDNGHLYDMVKDGLNKMLEAARWQAEHPEEEINPYNPEQLPLPDAELVAKIETILSDFHKNEAEKIGIITAAVLGAIAGIAQLYHVFGGPSALYGEEWKTLVQEGIRSGSFWSYLVYNIARTFGGGGPSSSGGEGEEGPVISPSPEDHAKKRAALFSITATAMISAFQAMDAEMQCWAETSHDYWKPLLPAIATGLAGIAVAIAMRGALFESTNTAGLAGGIMFGHSEESPVK